MRYLDPPAFQVPRKPRSVQKTRALIQTPNSRSRIIWEPTKGSPIYRNSNVILSRFSSKPAVYQPQAPLKEPSTLSKDPKVQRLPYYNSSIHPPLPAGPDKIGAAADWASGREALHDKLSRPGAASSFLRCGFRGLKHEDTNVLAPPHVHIFVYTYIYIYICYTYLYTHVISVWQHYGPIHS